MGVTSLQEFIRASFECGCEATFAEVAPLFDISPNEHPFELCIAVETELKKYGIQSTPPLPKGSEASQRLFFTPKPGLTCGQIRIRIAAGEGATSEFKGSMICCLRTLSENPNASKPDLKSDAVTHSLLKTLAAFLNTSGGSLYVGVGDDGAAIGLENDFPLLGPVGSTDTWELRLRELVETQFIDGKSVNNLLQVGFTEIDGRTVAHISIAPRKKISYLKTHKGAGHEVYVRQGNRTVSLTFPQFEEYLSNRN